MRERVDLDRRGSGEEPGGVEGGETLWEGKKSVFNKGG